VSLIHAFSTRNISVIQALNVLCVLMSWYIWYRNILQKEHPIMHLHIWSIDFRFKMVKKFTGIVIQINW